MKHPFLSFRLSEEFIAAYVDRPVAWGFDIGQGNTLSELTFITKYSRLKDDGLKERWYEVCRRVIEGMFSIQKDHCLHNQIPWNSQKARRAAEDAFERIFTFKWTPPGRGLEFMGTEIVNGERNSGPLLNCFTGDTRIVTSRGFKALQDLDGSSVTLMTRGGKWVDAPIRSFGEQRVWELTLERGGFEKKIYTTENHRWFARDRRQLVRTGVTGRRHTPFSEIQTKDLLPIHVLQEVNGAGIKGYGMVPSPFGVAHGFTFGDGNTKQHERNATQVTLFGEKDSSLIPYFIGCPSSSGPEYGGWTRFSALPNHFRELPSLAENKSYLYGWLAGYFAADGSMSSSAVISSANRANLEFVREVCSIIGIASFSITETERICNLNNKPSTLYRLILDRATLCEKFFILEKHRKQFMELGVQKARPKWKVKSVEPTDRVETVYCATVEGTHSFVLEDNILTGNCSFLSTEHLSLKNPTGPFRLLMEQSMMGVGVGFDTRGAGKITIHQPKTDQEVFFIADSREGWAESVSELLKSYFLPDRNTVEFDYSLIRPEGAPLKRFGKTASGPAPLQKLHESLRVQLNGRDLQPITSTDIVDICNKIGKAVVAGSTRRSAEIALGFPEDAEFLELKNWEVNPERMGPDGWGNLSNNCFEYKTEIVTKAGTKRLGDLVGQSVEVLTDYGKWVETVPKSYGKAKLWELQVTRSGHKKTIRCTGNHRWYIEGTGNDSGTRLEMLTTELKPGQFLSSQFAHKANASVRPSSIGIQHGIIYGDGTIAGDGQATVTLCGDKTELLSFFPSCHTTEDVRNGNWVGTRVSDGFPRSCKSLPSLEENHSFLLGWLMGYFATDGTTTSHTLRISSHKKESLEFVRDASNLLGIGVHPIIQVESTNPFTGEPHVMWSIAFIKHTLPKNFALRSGVALPTGKPRRHDIDWRVHSIMETDITEEVFCVEVPETHRFTLADNICTGNSVFVKRGDNVDHLIPGIVNNGEPGLIWLDDCQRYGRMNDAPTNRDYRVKGINPCHSATTRLLTKHGGMQTIKDLAELDSFEIWNGNEWAKSNAWKSGTKPVYRVNLTNGQSIELTADHRLATWSEGDAKGRNSVEGEMTVEAIAAALRDGKAPKIKPLAGSPTWDGELVETESAQLLGFVFGDGWSRGPSVYVKNGESEILEFLRSVDPGDWRIAGPIDGVSQTSCLKGLDVLCKTHGLDLTKHLPERELPSEIFGWSPESLQAFLRGLYSANGSAMTKHSRVMLKSTSSVLVHQVQIILSALGFASYITTNKPSLIKWENGTFESKESFDLNVSGRSQFERFQQEIGFMHIHKTQIAQAGHTRGPKSTRVRSVSLLGDQEVFDFTEPKTHWGWANGLKSHNCGEQPLENLELCTLTEMYPVNHQTLDDFLKTVKIAYLYGKSVTLLPTPWPECNEVMQRNRRIGLSMTGVAQFADSRGWNVLREWCEEAYQVVCHRDVIYSEWLGIRESIKRTTVKPSGTTSLVASVWPGVHWPVAAGRYLRRQRFRKTDSMVSVFAEAGYPVEPDVMDPEFTVVVTFPTSGPEGRSQREVSLWEKMALAALMGESWSDNAVSATFSFRPDEVDQIGPAIRANEGKLKTMSFLPLGEEGAANAYAQMPYEKISDHELDEMLAQIRPIDWEKVYANSEDASGDRFCDGDTCVI